MSRLNPAAFLGLVFSVGGLSLQPCQAAARGSVEATQLEYVALDAPVNCNRMFFRSSEHFKGTIFMMPRVVASSGPDGERSFNIVESAEPGKYLLNLRLYFPDNDDLLRPRGASQVKIDRNTCNTDVVKDALNRLASNESQKITTVARIPLTSIEVEIPGLKSPALIGRSLDMSQEVDILDYKNKVLTATFTINEEEKSYFLGQIVDPDGLPATVKFRFQARPRDGSVHAEINVAALQTNFAANVKGKLKVTKADISAALRASFDNRSITITSEAGQSDTSSKIADTIINKIMTDVSLAVDTASSKDAAAPSAEADDNAITVKAALEIIATKVGRQIQFDQIGVAETATAQTEIRIKVTSLRDSNILDVEVKAEAPEPSTGLVLLKDHSISITAVDWWVESINYDTTVKSFMTTGDLQTLQLAGHYPILTDSNFEIKDQSINGTLLAIGRRGAFGGYLGNLKRITEYRWIREQRIPKFTRIQSDRIEPTQIAFTDLPVGISFAALGGRYMVTLRDLFVENPYWSAEFEPGAGRVNLRAKQDLGLVQLRQKMHGADEIQYASQPIVYDSVVMERHDFWDGTQIDPPIALKTDSKTIVLQKTIRFSITRPEDAGTVAPQAVAAPAPAAAPLPQRRPEEPAPPIPPEP